MTYMKILLLLMFCTVLPMQAQQMKKLTDLKDFEARLLQEAKNIESILHSNKMMNQMQDMLTACMVGDLSNMSPGYALEYFEDAHYYLIQIKPVSKAIQAYINQIQIYLDKKDMSVHKLRLSETATNYTEYEFSDKKFNSLKDEAKFTIR